MDRVIIGKFGELEYLPSHPDDSLESTEDTALEFDLFVLLGHRFVGGSCRRELSRTIKFAIVKTIAWMATIEDLRNDDRASPNRMKRKGANGQPCLTDLEIGNNVP